MEEHKTEIAYWAGRLIGYDQSWEVAEEIVEAIKEAQQQALILPVVSRSIGLDTKPTLMELTPEQIDKEIGVCSLCIYHKNNKESEGKNLK